MNKWYRLGQQFSEVLSRKSLNNYLERNNLYNSNSGIQKDFKEKNYIEMCLMVGIEPEIKEEKQYRHGERKYYFYWGYDKGIER